MSVTPLAPLGLKGESGACDLKLRDSGREPEVERREALHVAFHSIWTLRAARSNSDQIVMCEGTGVG